jgi:hypothetical protein
MYGMHFENEKRFEYLYLFEYLSIAKIWRKCEGIIYAQRQLAYKN